MYKNYTLKEERNLPEMNGVGRLYEHSSGAEVLHIQNDDVNKSFNVMFRTPPADDTGVPHILEHCVLNGSENYPLKDPFFTMAKGSLQTFLNAITYPDITMYPGASYNDKDFFNLMGVYLDAVYKPLVHKRDLSFLQEGWHYCLENPEDDLTLNGVVYSEMKGYFSTPDVILTAEMNKLHYPQSHYRFDSGGDPKAIPNLTYEDFTNFHKTLYSPANSLIYLCGDMDIKKCFDLLDEYLIADEIKTEIKTEKSIDLTVQAPNTAPIFGEAEYSINEQDDPSKKNYLGAYYGMSSFPDPIELVGINALIEILMETPASPLKNKLLERKVGETVYAWFGVPSTTPVVTIGAKNSSYNAKELKGFAEEIINEILESGLDKKYVEACLNAYEFHLREKDYSMPKSLMTFFNTEFGWVYGLNPLDYFSPIEAISTIREKIKNGEMYFENLMKKIFIDNNFSTFLTLKAKPGLQAEDEEKLKKEMAEVKAGLSETQIKDIISQKAKLTEWQNTPDTKEQLATIPILSLNDIKKEATPLIMTERDFAKSKALYLDIPTDGISYNNFMFDVRCLSKEELPYVGILRNLLTKLDTKKRSFADLTSEISMFTGGISRKFEIHSHKDGSGFIPAFILSVKALEKNASFIYSLASEVLTETLFEDKNRIEMLLAEEKVNYESEFVEDGETYAVYRSSSYFYNGSAYLDLVKGYGFYEFLKPIVDDFENKFEELKQGLLTVSRKIFSKSAIVTGVLCSENVYASSQSAMSELLANLSEGLPNQDLILLPEVANEAFIIEAMINFNAKAFDYRKHGKILNGHVKVLNSIIDLEYLLNEIRVKGGAYGFGGKINHNGIGVLSSYMDPKLKRTYEVYADLPKFIAGFKPSEREMLQFVLGTINEIDRPRTSTQKLRIALQNYYAGMNAQDIQIERDEILSVTAKDIQAFAPSLEECIKEGLICTFGSESEINENKGLFKRVVKL